MAEYKGKKDNDVYSELEKRYLENGDQNAFWSMYLLVQRFETRFIRQYCLRHECVFSPDKDTHDEIVYDLATDMAVWMMKRYKDDPTFRCEKGMSAYAPFAFKKIMYDPNRVAREKRLKALEEEEVSFEHTVIIQDFETESEKRERYHKEKVAPGVYQGILPLFGESMEEQTE